MTGWRGHGLTPFHTPGTRHALAGNPETSDQWGPVLIFTVVDPDGHPFDAGPLAVLDAQRVRDLNQRTGEWLAEHDPGGGPHA